MKKLSLFVFFLCILTFGCGSPYQPNGLGGGYSETQLAPDTFTVFFRGNGYTSQERAEDFTVLRAAELTMLNDFKYFTVIGGNYSERIMSFTTGGSSYTTGQANITGGSGTYHANYSETTTYNPPQTFYSHHPRTSLTIKCFKDKPENVGFFDAEFIYKSLTDKYNIK